MKIVAVMIVVFACVYAQEQQYEQYVLIDDYPTWYVQPHDDIRHRRDVTYDRKVGDGKVFGTLGQNDAGLFGKAGYERNLFNDDRGKLDGSLHGTRVLGPNGDSSHLGGSLNWQKSNAAASLDISKQIHGRTTYDASAGGKWPVGKNGDISAQGFYTQSGGMKDYGGRGVYNYRF